MQFLNQQPLLSKYHLSPKKGEPKVEFEFQALGIEMEPIYGKKVWPLFYKYPVPMVRDAFKIAQKRGIMTYKYLMGIIHRLEDPEKYQ